MANMCDITLEARGFKTMDDMRECEEILTNGGWHREKAWLPLFDATTRINDDILYASGWCKWDAEEMMDWRITEEDRKQYPTLVSIQDLVKRYGIYIEILGRESGCNVGQHFGISPAGDMELEEHFDYSEYSTCDYDTYEDFVEDYGDVLTEEEFYSDDCVSIGEPDTPFGEWIMSRKVQEVKNA